MKDNVPGLLLFMVMLVQSERPCCAAESFDSREMKAVLRLQSYVKFAGLSDVDIRHRCGDYTLEVVHSIRAAIDNNDRKALTSALGKGLASNQVGVRLIAVETLAALAEDSEAVTHLEHALQDENQYVVALAGKAILRHSKSPGHAFVRALTNEPPHCDILFKGLQASGASADGVEIAVRFLNHEDSEARCAAVETLAAAGEGAREFVPQLLEMTKGEERWFVQRAILRAVSALEPERDDVVTALIAAFDNDWAQVRFTAAVCLRNVRADRSRALSALLRALEDPDLSVRAASAHTLWQLGSANGQVTGALIRMLRDESVEVRRCAAEILGQFGEGAARATPALKSCFKDPDLNVRVSAALAVWGITHDAAISIPAVVETLQTVNQLPGTEVTIKARIVRLNAIEALGQIGPEAVDGVGVLVSCLGSKDWRVRKEACVSLGKIGSGAKEAVPRLRTLLEDDDEGVRPFARKALKEIQEGGIR